MKGYKIFNSDWTCRGYQFEIGKEYIHEGNIKLCKEGFHFCINPSDLFNFYGFDPENKVAEIEATGKIIESEDKCVTKKIKILKEIKWGTVLSLVNTGKGNSGYRNSGDYNSGYRNSGNYNSGYRNSGYCNSGHHNSGNYNSGDYNSGYRNSGDYNSTNNSTGVFCTIEPKILIFDEPTNMTLREFRQTQASSLLSNLILNEWIFRDEMTDEEKEKYPNYETAGGYLKTYEYKEAWSNLWQSFNKKQKQIIKDIPNFNANKFEEITGIKV